MQGQPTAIGCPYFYSNFLSQLEQTTNYCPCQISGFHDLSVQ